MVEYGLSVLPTSEITPRIRFYDILSEFTIPYPLHPTGLVRSNLSAVLTIIWQASRTFRTGRSLRIHTSSAVLPL